MESLRPASPGRVSLRQRGLRWEVTLRERRVLVADSRGARYLEVLTANVEQDILAAALASGVQAGWWSGTPQPVLDHAARTRYRDRLSELDIALQASDSVGDAARSETLAREREWLLRELAAAAGLGGRPKAFATDEERARVAVGKAIWRAVDHIGRADPVIGEHLRLWVRTGRYCVYLPGW